MLFILEAETAQEMRDKIASLAQVFGIGSPQSHLPCSTSTSSVDASRQEMYIMSTEEAPTPRPRKSKKSKAQDESRAASAQAPLPAEDEQSAQLSSETHEPFASVEPQPLTSELLPEQPTVEQVKHALNTLVAAKGIVTAQNVLKQSFNVSTIREAAPELYSGIIEACRKAAQ